MKFFLPSINCAGLHADGERDYANAIAGEHDFLLAEAKLDHRINRWCQPRSLFRCLRLWMRQAKLLRQLRRRHLHHGSLF